MPTHPYRLNSTNLHYFPPPPFSTSTVFYLYRFLPLLYSTFTVFYLYRILPPPYSTIFHYIPPTPLVEFGRIQQNLVEYNRTTLTSTVFHLPIGRNQQNTAELSRIRQNMVKYLPPYYKLSTPLALRAASLRPTQIMGATRNIPQD